MNHFNWTQLIPGVGHHYIHIATAIIAVVLLFIFGFLARMALYRVGLSAPPANHFSIRGIFEVIIDINVGLSDMVLGPKGRMFIPLFTAIFLFVLVNNLFGLLPGMSPATDNMNTTLAVGLFSFVVYNFYGFKAHGFAYLKHFLGPLVLLAPLMLPIELISHVLRPFTLGLRLSGNMIGDHTVLSVFTELVPIGVPVVFYGLGLFVCLMQAFLFTLLTMVYISLAISHDH